MSDYWRDAVRRRREEEELRRQRAADTTRQLLLEQQQARLAREAVYFEAQVQAARLHQQVEADNLRRLDQVRAREDEKADWTIRAVDEPSYVHGVESQSSWGPVEDWDTQAWLRRVDEDRQRQLDEMRDAQYRLEVTMAAAQATEDRLIEQRAEAQRTQLLEAERLREEWQRTTLDAMQRLESDRQDQLTRAQDLDAQRVTEQIAANGWRLERDLQDLQTRLERERLDRSQLGEAPNRGPEDTRRTEAILASAQIRERLERDRLAEIRVAEERIEQELLLRRVSTELREKELVQKELDAKRLDEERRVEKLLRDELDAKRLDEERRVEKLLRDELDAKRLDEERRVEKLLRDELDAKRLDEERRVEKLLRDELDAKRLDEERRVEKLLRDELDAKRLDEERRIEKLLRDELDAKRLDEERRVEKLLRDELDTRRLDEERRIEKLLRDELDAKRLDEERRIEELRRAGVDADRIDAERRRIEADLERQRVQREREERERLEADLERQRVQREREERERLEADLERQRVQREREERERLEENLERQRVQREREERERLEENLERQRVQREREERERVEENLERQRVQREREERDRLKTDLDRLRAERWREAASELDGKQREEWQSRISHLEAKVAGDVERTRHELLQQEPILRFRVVGEDRRELLDELGVPPPADDRASAATADKPVRVGPEDGATLDSGLGHDRVSDARAAQIAAALFADAPKELYDELGIDRGHRFQKIAEQRLRAFAPLDQATVTDLGKPKAVGKGFMPIVDGVCLYRRRRLIVSIGAVNEAKRRLSKFLELFGLVDGDRYHRAIQRLQRQGVLKRKTRRAATLEFLDKASMVVPTEHVESLCQKISDYVELERSGDPYIFEGDVAEWVKRRFGAKDRRGETIIDHDELIAQLQKKVIGLDWETT